MGWFFNRNNEPPAQQFGASNSMYGTGAGAMGAYGMQQNGMMDPFAMQQMGQNPFMQQMANDPVIATHKLLQNYDPMSAFIVSNNFGMLLDLVTEVVALSPALCAAAASSAAALSALLIAFSATFARSFALVF